jgi:hypothetical protein
MTEALSRWRILAKVLNRGAIHMNGTRTMLAVVFSLVLVLSTLPAATVSFIGQFHISRLNGGGSNFVNLTASATTFCYLSRVFVAETDVESEFAGCRLVRGSSVWTLYAHAGNLGSTGDQDAYCSVICYNN